MSGTSVNSCRARQPEWETSVEDKCGRQVFIASKGVLNFIVIGIAFQKPKSFSKLTQKTVRQ